MVYTYVFDPSGYTACGPNITSQEYLREWAMSLPADEYVHLQQLVYDGITDDLRLLAKETKDAIRRHKPPKGVLASARYVIELALARCEIDDVMMLCD
jgi:hypothetical protein